ncbi:Uncharacterised protein [BD1-7 clade bacterium]|uniref:Amine oxidase domain-containing protein n=1 Tax=BD1-7 clade bacterium TaxID=2029982 RepID=A0A5S9R1U0_9GAMM|nr:Uncharacterised protein [BD1-7 clade bacterium]
MKIAIIGSGISGLSAAWMLHKDHDITLFEKADRLGGHTATIDVDYKGENHAIDTGFIVYNDWTYPNFIRLMQACGVESIPTKMGFSVTAHNHSYEYSGASIKTLFAQRKNLLSVKHWGMIYDIVRFNREAISDLENNTISAQKTLGSYLKEKGYGQQFINYYLIPMGCAIWSASTEEMLNFPLYFFVRFFKNHGLLSVTDRPQWHVLKGGSRAYLAPLTRPFADRIRLSRDINTVIRTDDDVTLVFADGTQDVFDQVVFACHSDEALALLETPTAEEKQILEAIPYRMNDVVLHTDTSLLPKVRETWSSWNYFIDDHKTDRPVLTYNMNILQSLESRHTFCVTLNATELIDPNKIIGTYQYGHPVFTLDGIDAQEQWQAINGVKRTWFCGAYWRNGFHEDGCASGIRVAEGLGSTWPT